MHKNRSVIVCIALFCLGCGASEKALESDAERTVDAAMIYPKFRIWTTPSQGAEAEVNSPSFQWPSRKKAVYSIRISSSKDFSTDLIEKEGIPFAIFNPHQLLSAGKWYWQYKAEKSNWEKLDSFLIRTSTPVFPTPEFGAVVKKISRSHPRVLASQESLADFRSKTATYKERAYVLAEAEKYLNQSPPEESSGKPDLKGKNDFENEKLAMKASKKLGERLSVPLSYMSQAYTITGDEKYFVPAKRWMLEAAALAPDGVTMLGNFGDASIMSSLAVGLDTFWDRLTPSERDSIMNQVAVRANRFYEKWTNQVESRSSSMHVWQGILLDMFQTSTALMHETDDAALWMEYVYELWIAQSPKMGETDGAWFNGVGYFKLNTLALYSISLSLQELTGVDFMWNSWYRNNPRWLLYAFPPGSVIDGFGNGSDNNLPTITSHAAYANIAARAFGDPYAAWYAAQCESKAGFSVEDEAEFAWFRMTRSNDWPLPDSIVQFELPQAAVFPDVGVAYMHTAVQNSAVDLMFSIRSSPFGPMGHAHADQNTFNIAYGGERLFYNTGYRPTMGDPHFLGWYKHTQGHNGVLIDGEGQPFNAGAYGWIPRFLHGDQVSYTVGDASHAYSGSDEGKNINFGMKSFRRHYLMLRPSTLVIYDELEADHLAEWSWLIHNDTGLKVDAEKRTIVSENEWANAQVSLYTSSPIDFQVTDQFSVPVENWTQKVDEEGEVVVFENQWHFKGISQEKTARIRFLAIIQVKPKSGEAACEAVLFDEKSNTYSVGEWKIKAEMNTDQAAKIHIEKSDGSAGLVSTGPLEVGGKAYKGKATGSAKLMEIIAGKPAFQETTDQIPAAMKKASLQFEHE